MAGKVAVITGAAQGLGKCFAEALLKSGSKVCMADLNVKVGKRTEEEMQSKYGANSSFFMQCDVKSQNELDNVFQETFKRYKKIDIVCNNAGIMHEGKWEDMVDINLNGVYRGTLLGRKYMGKDNGGSGGLVINVASMAGIYPMPFGPIYTASKHAVVGLTKAMALDPLFKQHGVRSAALCPAIVDTDIVNVKPDQVTNTKLAEKFFTLLGRTPIENVAEAFTQLVEDDRCNGKILTIDPKNGIKEYKYKVGQSSL